MSVSTQIAGLRRLLLNGENDDTETGKWFRKAADVSDNSLSYRLLLIDLARRDLYL